MSTQDFLNKFQEQMDKLTNVRRNIQSNIEFRTKFTSDVKNGLSQINAKLQQLANLIKELKNKSDTLETQINSNTNSIGEKEKEVQQLKSQIASLESQRNDLDQSTNKIAQQQSKIDEYEEQLRQIQQKFDNQTTQLTALQDEMSKSGNEKDASHAQAINQLATQSQTQLEAQKKQLDEEKTQLLQKINDCEGKIQQTETQATQKQQEIEQAQSSLQELQQQIDSLKSENALLVERLKDATGAIVQATEDLQTLMTSVPNTQSKDEIDALLNQISQQIDQSMQDIGRAAQGQTSTQLNTLIPLGEVINLQDSFTQNPVQMKFGDLLKDLLDKYNKSKNPKYNQAFNELKKASTPSESVAILAKNNIEIKNSNILGGKRKKMSRKTKKQKGGFTYRTSSKRKSISSKTTSRRTSKSSSKRSLR